MNEERIRDDGDAGTSGVERGDMDGRATALLADLVRESLLERRRSRRWRIGLRVLTLTWLTAVIAWFALDGDSAMSGEPGPHTAVVRVEGMIAAGAPANAGAVIDAVERALESDSAQGVVLAINSPGGSPVESDIIFRELRRLRDAHPSMPVHAVVGDVAASGGYYIAAAAERIYANPASIVGSIGVRFDSFGATEAIERLGVERRLLTAGEHKGLLDPFLPVDPVARRQVQTMIDGVHEEFITAVRNGRGDRLGDDEALFSGLIWNGREAVGNGLVDDIGDVRSVARDVVGEARLVDYTNEEDLFARVADRFAVQLRSLLVDPVAGLRF